ncbi:hypothetical protein BBJ29_007538 [Phytophthora kernoviae]|uniref:Uncharacterized protein n=1 Tax=Phytophthora kernoviae TaxID=325452 RepID=A0A3F2REI4_9STRA|nr:hypothetical protein BBP00_00008762 [Phytophthora kernoviae]RLN58243.1 hypothetical protein BBJ29_007538 [Phytophthora kernoviae]
MVGNKHKNGIICTYPGCSKTMRTQKFKLHFTKAHLKQGEVYSVEHRREYEVAREDNSGGGEADTRTVVKHETLEGVAVITSVAAGTEPMMNPTSSASNKRPSSAMDAEAADPSSSLLVEFVAMMDQRFQELVGKMGEMIEVQKQLIDALQTKNPGVLGDQAPALALASAAEVVMKRRKKDASSGANHTGDSSGNANNGFIL